MRVAYPHIAERLFGRVHAIEPVALRAIMDGPLAKRVLSGESVGGKQVKKTGRDLRRARLSALAGGVQQVREADGLIEFALTPEGVAIVPVMGVLSRRFDWLAAACGWTTYEGLSATIDSVVGDERVRGILLDVDTPGGESAGMLDAADKILAARALKPVWAVADVCAASAGYALAGSAGTLVMPRLGIVGSIGCMLVHIDQSLSDVASGLVYTAIYSGARKIDGWGHAPLSDGARAEAQADVDHVRDAFADLVARQGRISAKAALATEAACFSDDDAVKVGLADAVMTFDQALAQLTAQLEDSMAKPAANLQSTTSSAAIAAATAAASAVAATQSEGAAVAASATPQSKKLDADVDPPKPGEKCALCGQVMPDDDDDDAAGDEPGNDQEQQTRRGKGGGSHHQVVPAAAAATYSADDAQETVELCTIARLPQLATAFIKTRTPLKAVRANLAARAAAEAEADGAIATDRVPTDPNAQAVIEAKWDSVVAELNMKNGPKK